MSDTATISHGRPSLFPAWLGEGLARRRQIMKRAAARRARYRQTLFELSILSNRELADIGIVRDDIRRIAREARDQLEA